MRPGDSINGQTEVNAFGGTRRETPTRTSTGVASFYVVQKIRWFVADG
jgi:hypothetical protein